MVIIYLYVAIVVIFGRELDFAEGDGVFERYFDGRLFYFIFFVGFRGVGDGVIVEVSFY